MEYSKKKIRIEKLSNQIFITPSIGIVKVSAVFYCPAHINLCFAWINRTISIRIWTDKSKEDAQNANSAN